MLTVDRNERIGSQILYLNIESLVYNWVGMYTRMFLAVHYIGVNNDDCSGVSICDLDHYWGFLFDINSFRTIHLYENQVPLHVSSFLCFFVSLFLRFFVSSFLCFFVSVFLRFFVSSFHTHYTFYDFGLQC